MSYTQRLNNRPLIYSSPVARIPGTPISLRVKRHSPLYPNRRPIFPKSPIVHSPLISSAEMNRLYQQKVNEEAHQLKRKKRDEIMKSINQNRMHQLYSTPEHPDYHDTEVNYRDAISIQKMQQNFEDKMDEAENSYNAGIWFGGRKKRTQKRKPRKTKKKKQNKRKSRKSRK